MTDIVLNRGERLNNPLNIRINDQKFQGEVQPSSDPDFKEFESPVMGIRAGCRLLLTYYKKYGLNDLTAIINRWAPPVENDTASYCADVAQFTGLGPNDAFKVDDPANMALLAMGIVHHEQGRVLWTNDIFLQAGKLALGLLPIEA